MIFRGDEFAQKIDDIMENPSENRALSKGREAFWDNTSGTVVIKNPNAADMGTAFKPAGGKAYFDNLK